MNIYRVYRGRLDTLEKEIYDLKDRVCDKIKLYIFLYVGTKYRSAELD
jgi:hypothetical protein